jgi:hypothetical protein
MLKSIDALSSYGIVRVCGIHEQTTLEVQPMGYLSYSSLKSTIHINRLIEAWLISSIGTRLLVKPGTFTKGQGIIKWSKVDKTLGLLVSTRKPD